MQISSATPSGDTPRDASRLPAGSPVGSVQSDTEQEAQTTPRSVVLIVEDELLIAMSIKNALGDAGFPVLGPAVTYEGAMSFAGERRPDIALVNIDLRSERDGGVVALHLMEQFATPSIYISGAAWRVAANQDCAWGSVAKPYDVETIVETVRVVARLLSGREPGSLPDGLTLFQSAVVQPQSGAAGVGLEGPHGEDDVLV
jgi:DNA-binding response OmpR family regulator